MNRRGFLRALGIGGTAVVSLPLIKNTPLSGSEDVEVLLTPEEVAAQAVDISPTIDMWPGIKKWTEEHYRNELDKINYQLAVQARKTKERVIADVLNKHFGGNIGL